MDKEYLSITDFAARAKVSKQSIYKRLNQLNNQLNNYVEMIDNQRMIDIRALQEIYGIEVEQPSQPKNNQVEQPNQPDSQPQNDTEKLLIEMLQKELDEKNKQIENLQRLVDQEQQLNMANHKKILLLEEKLQEQEPDEQSEPTEQQTKKSWWNRIFDK